MSSAVLLRTQVSKDLLDYWVSTTDGSGSTSTLVDSLLQKFDDSEIRTRRASFLMTSGTSSGEERQFSSKSTSTVTVVPDFGNAITSGLTYEMHRMFTAEEKNFAVTAALTAVFPFVHVPTVTDVTPVANQHLYDISTQGLKDDLPTAVLWSGPGDVELGVPISGWEMRGINLYLPYNLPITGKYRVLGMKIATATATTTPQELIVSAQAVVSLLAGAASDTPNDMLGPLEQLLPAWQSRYVERVQLGGMLVPPRYIDRQFQPAGLTPIQPAIAAENVTEDNVNQLTG